MIKIFEAFSGYGSQRMAIKRLGIPYESVGISEIEENVINSYAYIHEDLEKKLKTFDIDYPNITKEEMVNYLESINVPLHYKTFKNMARKLPLNRLKKMYLANKISNNYGDISKIDPEKLPDFDLFTYSFPCFTKDTLVLTDKGYERIINIKKGDKVMTHNGHFKNVIASGKTGTKEVYTLTAMGTCNLKATANHLFYVRERYRKGYPSVRLFKEPEWKELCHITKDHYLGVPINKNNVIPNDPYLQKYMNNEDFWFIIGQYIGDGWKRSQGGIIICGNDKKVSCLTDKLKKCDINHSIVKERTCIKVHIASKKIEKFVEQFGFGATNKHLTNTILDLPINLLSSFLDGYLMADGSKVGKLYKITTVSEMLAYEIMLCVAKVYQRPASIYFNKRPKKHMIENRIVNQKDNYGVVWKIDNDKQDKAFFDNGYIWYPINNIKYHDTEDVYDITVEDDHSFIANNVIVHNCQDISIAGKRNGFKEGSGTRSSLLWECCKIIETKKPKYLLMENVKNLISKKNIEYFESFLSFLEEMGYKNYYQVLNAKDYGVPQNRERVFCVSIRNDIDQEFKFPEKRQLGKLLKDILDDNVDPKYYLSQKLLQGFKLKTADSLKKKNGFIFSPTNGESIAKTITTKAGQRVTDNFIYNDKIDEIGKINIGNNESNNRIYGPNGISPTLNTMQGGHRQPKVLIEGNSYVSRKYSEFFEKNKYLPEFFNPYNCYDLKNIAPTLSTGCGSTTNISGILKADKIPLDMMIAASRGRYKTDGKTIKQNLEINKDGLSDTLTTVQKDNYLLMHDKEIIQRGHGYNQRGIKDICLCITNHSFENNNYVVTSIQGTNIGCIIIDNFIYYIRKLTPQECFKLMGVDPSDFNKIKDHIAETQLYKQAGNSIVVNVLEAIFDELFKNLMV